MSKFVKVDPDGETDENYVEEEEKLVKLNPVPVDEDGNSESYTMLGGYLDEEGTLHKTFTVREMTGRDEEAIARGDVQQNPAKAISILLERCVTSIGTLTKKELGADKWRDIIRNIYTGDQDYMIIKLREISAGDEMEIQHTCPACKGDLKTIINLSELTLTPFNGLTQIPFELPKGFRDKNGVVHKKGFMRPANGLDREILMPVAKKNMATANTLMLTRVCKFEGNVPITNDTMSDLTIKDREYLQNLIVDNQFGVDLSLEITCTLCGESFEGTVNTANFI